MSSRRVCIFGGSFDPVHTGHMLIAEAAVKQFGLTAMVMVPARQSPHKPTAVYAPADHRVAMLKAAIRGRTRFAVSDVEIRSAGPSYTVDTIRRFREEYQGDALYLLIGSDHLSAFRTWKDPGEISRLARIIVYQRWEHAVRKSDLKRWRAQVLRGPDIFISATAVRRRRSTGRTIRYFVPPAVERYIMKHHLYTKRGQGR